MTIEADGEIVAQGTADITRAELAAEGIGDGGHGFALDLTPSLRGRSHVPLVALVGAERVLLPVSPSFWQSSEAGGGWSGVRFSHGRAGAQQSGGERRLEAAPPPRRAASRAVVGSDGWLFDADEFLESSQDAADLAPQVLRELAMVARSCSEMGVAYVPAVMPAKHEAVGDHASASDRGIWWERLVAELRDIDDLELLDLLPVLRDARRHGPCYHRTDRGLNPRGAFFVARAVIKEASKRAPALRPLPLDRLHLTIRDGYRGDLADAQKLLEEGQHLQTTGIDIEDEIGIEVDVAHLRSNRLPADEHLAVDGVHARLYVVDDDPHGARLVVVGGESGLDLLPWLCESATRTSFFWTTAAPLVPIEIELPDAVIQIFGINELIDLAQRSSVS